MTLIKYTLATLLLLSSQLVNAVATYQLTDSIQAYLDGATWVTVEPVPVSPYTDFLQFDSGTGTSWAGWTWNPDIAYGMAGWELDVDVNGPFGGGQVYSNGQTRSFNKGDYGANNLAEIDATVRAPSTSTGGSLKIYETGTDKQNTWWVWYDGENFGSRGLADSDTDRLSFYVKIDGLNPQVVGGVPQLTDGTMRESIHFGTFLCFVDHPNDPNSGYGCPKESYGNQHYYHTSAMAGDTWVHMQIDSHPTHQRGGDGSTSSYSPEPALEELGMYYFENMMQFYFENRDPQDQEVTTWVDDFRFWKTSVSPEPNQNDISISTLWIGYNDSDDKWSFGFIDDSISPRNDVAAATYQIRYSTSPITNANWSSATIIQTEFYSKSAYTDNPNNFRKPKFWYKQAWDRFTLPDAIEDNNDRLYFAIKDVSVQGQHAGTSGDHVNGDLRSSPSPYIKTIDYSLRTN